MKNTGTKFFEYIEERGISQSQAAKMMNLSAGVLSSYKSGDYKGNLGNVEERMEKFLREAESRRRALKLEVLPIGPFRQIQDACDIALEEQDIAVITGSAGVGKTTALESYVNDSYGAAVLVKVNKTFTQYKLIKELARSLGVLNKGAAGAVTERIIDYLKDHNKVIIIDEADYLSPNSLEYLRQVVNDAGESGLVLCGIQRLAYQIKRDSNDHDQLLSRVGVHLAIDSISDQDLKLVIKSVYPKLGDKLVRKLLINSKMKFYGIDEPSLRTLTKLLKRLHRFLWKYQKKEVDEEAIDSVASLIMRRAM